MAWRVARSLDKLLAQINAYAPNRSKISDGSIGDTAHSSRVSDHNPDPRGIVHARDFTHSPTRGFDAHAFVRRLAKAGDRRIKYLISNRQISNPSISAGRWRPYSGINPHTQHAHVSCVYGALEDNTANWPGIGATAGIVTAPTPPAAPPKPKGVLGMTKRVQTDTNSKPQTIGAKPDHSYHLWIDEKQKNMSPVIGPAHFGLNAVIEITGCQPGERVVGQIQRAYYGDGPTRLGYAHGIDEGYANNNGTLILNIPANGYIAKKSGKASVRLRVTLKHNGGNPITVRRVRILGNTD